MNVAKLILSIFLLIPLYAQAGVIVGDKEWRQGSETTNFSWNQIASVCSQSTGVCSGSIGAVSFSGWTWANVGDVLDLFNTYIPGTTNDFPATFSGALVEPNSTWAPQFFVDFLPTFTQLGISSNVDWTTRDTHPTRSDLALYMW